MKYNKLELLNVKKEIPVFPSFRQGLPESRSHGWRVRYVPVTWTPAFPAGVTLRFCFLDKQYPIEWKVGQFEPEYLGKLSFYLETLDRDAKNPHERLTSGVLLCASKDDEVVEYALSRSRSPALIAEYQTQLPAKELLQAKLHEFYLQNAPHDDPNDPAGIRA